MPHPSDSPLKDKAVRHQVASTCYAEVAIAAGGVWIPAHLEKAVLGRDSAHQSGLFRRMSRGIVPNDTTAQRLRSSLGERCNVPKWRDHPFWKLLSKQPVGQKDIQAALLSVDVDVWQHIWDDHPPPYLTEFPYTRLETTNTSIDKITECENLDSFVALVALAREARDHGMLALYFWASFQSKEVFPSAIGSTPHLYLCWKPLARRINTGRNLVPSAPVGHEWRAL